MFIFIWQFNYFLFSDLPLVLTALKGLSIDMKEILANQRMILHHLGKSDIVKEKFFTEKYKLEVPFRTEEEFTEFDNKLKNNNDSFRTEFVSIAQFAIFDYLHIIFNTIIHFNYFYFYVCRGLL